MNGLSRSSTQVIISLFRHNFNFKRRNCDTGKEGSSHQGHTFRFCTTLPTPNELDPVCDEFFRFTLSRANGSLLDPLYAVEDVEGGKVHTCYHRQSRGEKSLGWCATCDPEASPGKPGHCGSKDRNLESEMTLAESERHWGWCDVQCGSTQLTKVFKLNAVTKYTFTDLDLLTDGDCEEMTGKNSTLVMCAASKREFPRAKAFKKVGEGVFEEVEAVPGTHYKLGHYYGGTDSCSGDSGEAISYKHASKMAP